MGGCYNCLLVASLMRVPEILHLLRCPRCGSSMESASDRLLCLGCQAAFPVEDGIPLLFADENPDADPTRVTERIRGFYEENPFPDYSGFEDLAGLLEKAREGVFARLLDEQIPFGVRVLECGCGTGQLSNFLGIAHRGVLGTDLSLPSLRLAEQFRSRHSLSRVHFLQMNLFRPCLIPAAFDIVLCNGVLHHTRDPFAGLARLAELVRPGGFLIVGLYHRFGRLATDFRRILFRWAGGPLAFLDPRMRSGELGGRRASAWYADQYRNPHESKHTIADGIDWLRLLRLEFVRSIPKTHLLEPFRSDERLFEAELPAGRFETFLKEASMALRIDPEGGFFTLIARRPS